MPRLGSPLRDLRSASLLVGVVGALVFANALENEFAFDDVPIVVQNPVVQSLDSLSSIIRYPYWPGGGGQEHAIWRPATTATLSILNAIGGGEAVVFHAVNVVGHAVASVLVLLIGAALMPLLASLIAGLLFAVHPLHVDSVANVVGIAEVMSGAAALAACLIHVRGPERTAWPRALAIGALYLLAFGFKESGVTLPALLFLVDAVRRRIGFADLAAYLRDRWRVYFVVAVVAAAVLLQRSDVLGGLTSPVGPLGADLLEDIPRIWTLGEVWTHYVRLWVFPLDLAADYAPNIIPISMGWTATNVVGVALALAVLSGALVAWRRSDMQPDRLSARAAAFGVVWFLIAVSPIANVVFLSGVLLAERTLYLPSVGLAFASGWLIARLGVVRPRLAVAVLVLAVGLSVARTWTRTPVWRDNQGVFNSLLRDYPHSGRSQWLLGDEFANAGNFQRGLVSYRAAVNILDSHYSLLTHIALRFMDRMDLHGAERIFTVAWYQHPEISTAPRVLAWILAEQGDAIGAERWARRSIAIYEADAERHHILAWALATQGRFEEGRRARARADELGPTALWHHWAYSAYARRADGDTASAIAMLDSAWADAGVEFGRAAVDAIRVQDFGLAPLLVAQEQDSVAVNR